MSKKILYSDEVIKIIYRYKAFSQTVIYTATFKVKNEYKITSEQREFVKQSLESGIIPPQMIDLNGKIKFVKTKKNRWDQDPVQYALEDSDPNVDVLVNVTDSE